MTYSIYDARSGIITSRVRNANQIQDRPYINGNYTPGRWYVKNQEIKPIPEQPQASAQSRFRWDIASESWILDMDATTDAARDIRNSLFADVDKVNPMWYASMTPEQQAQVTAYRQAILDITDQPGWPTQIDWPVKPAWL